MSQSLEPSQAQLRWRCRRGMLELDVLLERWLEQSWSDASASKRRAFERLLECEDDQIWDWLCARTVAADSDLRRIVEDIRDGSGFSNPGT